MSETASKQQCEHITLTHFSGDTWRCAKCRKLFAFPSPPVGTNDHLAKIKNERLTWGMICQCNCQACLDLDAVIRGEPVDQKKSCGCVVLDGVTHYCTDHCQDCGAEKTTLNPSSATREVGERASVTRSEFETPADGYMDAYYQIANLLDMPAMPISPKEAFETMMLPRLRELLAEKTSVSPAHVFADADNNGRDARVLIAPTFEEKGRVWCSYCQISNGNHRDGCPAKTSAIPVCPHGKDADDCIHCADIIGAGAPVNGPDSHD
jgi:hypothetical protein